MPLYEYYCQPCNGIFEELRPMREATEAVPCPVCYKDANRIMPTSFAAFTYRDGYPRRIPDDGKFWHLGQKVTKLVSQGKPNEHPEINKPQPKKRRTKAERAEIKEMKELSKKGELKDAYGNYIPPTDVPKVVERGSIVAKGTPNWVPRELER